MREIINSLICYAGVLSGAVTAAEIIHDVLDHQPIQVWTDLGFGIIPIVIVFGAWLMIKPITKTLDK